MELALCYRVVDLGRPHFSSSIMWESTNRLLFPYGLIGGAESQPELTNPNFEFCVLPRLFETNGNSCSRVGRGKFIIFLVCSWLKLQV